MWVAGVTVGTGPLLYFLLPYLTHTELSSWLSDHHLDGFLFIVMIPYFGLIHPFLEQLHWAPLREKTPAAHFIFAGYHMLVLYSLVTVPWLAVCFVVLVGASFGWCIMARKSESLVAPIMSHVLADSGVVLAAWGVWELQV
jgi:hypothetical protein